MRLALSEDHKKALQIKREELPIEKRQHPFMKKISEDTDAMKASRMLIASLKESQDKDREILNAIRLILENPPKQTPEHQEKKQPEKWEFDVIRGKDGNFSKIIAKQILGDTQ